MWSRPSPSTLAALLVLALAAPTTTGVVSGQFAAALAPLALVGLLAWGRSAWLGALVATLAALASPSLGVALALAGAVVRRGSGPLFLAALLAALARPSGLDAALVPGEVARPSTGLLLALVALAGLVVTPAALGRDWTTAALVTLGLGLGVGPVVAPGVAGPALPLAWLGLDGGWAGASALAVAAVARRLARWPARGALLVAALLAVEGVALGLRTPPAERTPPLARFLGERSGSLLVLPFALCDAPPGDVVARTVLARADRWRAWGRDSGRAVYNGAGCLAAGDPVLGDPVLAGVANVLWPESPVFIPAGVSARVLRSVGVTEVLVDRAALDEVRLAALDPVLAKLLGPPQRDVAGALDSYRVSTAGPRGRVAGPYLRAATGDAPPGWRTLDDVLGGAGRAGIPAAHGKRQ